MPVAAFGDRELISDYRFLEEAAALRDSCARDTQRMVKTQKLQQLRQLQTSVQLCVHVFMSPCLIHEPAKACKILMSMFMHRFLWHASIGGMILCGSILQTGDPCAQLCMPHKLIICSPRWQCT